MAITYGFYNSVNKDRTYNAIQMSQLFDGLILDGVFYGVGNRLNVSPSSGMSVQVDTGRAWFDHTWTLNDSIFTLDIDQSSVSQDRIDAIVLEVRDSEAERTNDIIVVKGTSSTSAEAPQMTDEGGLHQHVLAYVSVPKGTTEITASNITNMIGTDETPYVTGAVQSVSVDELVAQWQSVWSDWLNQEKTAFGEWFSNLQNQLDNDQVGHLQNQIDTLNEFMDSAETITDEEIIELINNAFS